MLMSNGFYSQLPARGSLWPMAARYSDTVRRFRCQQQHYASLIAQNPKPLCLGPHSFLSSEASELRG